MKFFASQLLLLSLLTAAAAGAAPAPSATALFAQGLLELSQNHPAAAYSTLERGFAAETDASKKAHMARLLASANPKLLTRPRQEYARFALLAATNLAAAEKQTLLRIVADALFEAGDVAGAERSYRQALALSRADSGADTDREYLTYKFGWTRLSQGHPADAYQIWADWLGQSQNQSSPLRKLLLKDSGRAWAENAMSEKPAALALELPVSPAEATALNEGIAAGVQRSLSPDFTRLARALGSSKHRDAVIGFLLTSNELFEAEPCQALQLLDAGLVKQNEPAKRLLLACATTKKHEPLAASHKLADLLLTFEVDGLNRWTKARVLDEAGLKPQACAEYSGLLAWQLKQADVANAPAIVADVLSACPKDKVLEPTLLAVTTLFSAPAVATATQASPEQWTKALVGVLREPALQSIALKTLLAAKDLWQHTKLPLLALELFKQDPAAQQAIFTTYCPMPLAAGFSEYFVLRIHGLLGKGQIDRALLELGQYAPLEKIHEHWAQRLWAAAFTVAPDKVNPAQLASSYAERLSGSADLDVEDTRALALVYARMHDWTAIWTHWKLLSSVVEKSRELSLSLVNGSLENLTTVTATLAGEPHAPALTYLKALAALVDNAAELRQPLAHAPAPFRGQAIEKDASALAALRALEPSYANLTFKVDRSLKAKLARKIATLKTRLGAARKHSWSSRLFLEAADHSVVKMANALATSIAAVSIVNDEATAADLKSLAGIIREWRVLDSKERS